MPWTGSRSSAQGQDRLLCYDAGGNYLTVLDKSGSAVFSQTPEQTIFDADLSSGGYSAMLTAGDSGRSLLQVYDPNGSLLYKRSTKSHYLSACAVSPDGSHAAAVALGQADITFSASLQLYRTDSEEIAAECALGSEMPYDIAFVTDSVVCAVSEDRVGSLRQTAQSAALMSRRTAASPTITSAETAL